MLAVMRELSTAVEYYSIDEFFFDATPPRGLDPARDAVTIRDEFREQVGVPVTVGIARTRTLAKLISEMGKPFGAVAVLDRASAEAVLGRLAVTEVTGIAGRRERRLGPWGVQRAWTWRTPTGGWCAGS
jgi:nucleotidyltransferase/DNA polymerase involved in DNA repair